MKMCIYNVYHVTGNYIIASMIMVTMVVLAVSSCFENNDYIKTCRNPIHRCSWRWSKVVQGVPVYLNSFFKEPYSSFIRQTSCSKWCCCRTAIRTRVVAQSWESFEASSAVAVTNS